MIECDPAACAEIVQTQKQFIRETIPLVVLAGVLIWFKSRVYNKRKGEQAEAIAKLWTATDRERERYQSEEKDD